MAGYEHRSRRTEPTPPVKAVDETADLINRDMHLHYAMEQYIMGIISRGDLANMVYAIELKFGRIDPTTATD